MGTAIKNPSWWSDKHSSSWERVKEAFHRDWEQTKADFSKKKGQELNQNVGDTIKQAAHKEAIPPEGIPNVKASDKGKKKSDVTYEDAEPALRYGYGAASQYDDAWSPDLENKLSDEWSHLGATRGWDDVRDDVRAGYERGKKV